MGHKLKTTSQIFGLPQAFISIALLFVAAESNAINNKIQSLESIHHAIKEFISSSYDPTTKLEIKIGLNDTRLRLNRCDRSLNVFWGSSNKKLGNTSVGIRCEGLINWVIYAPVKIKVYKAVVVTRNTLTKQQPLTHQDIQIEERDIAALVNGYIYDIDKYIGHQTKRTLMPGTVLSPNMLKAPSLVRRGEQVTLLATKAGIEVRMQGTALNNGGAGESIKIRNKSSKRIINGVIIAPGIVQVHL